MSTDSALLQTVLDTAKLAMDDAYNADPAESDQFLDLNRTYLMLTLLSCFAKNVRGKIYNGNVTESIQNTPSLVANYFLEHDSRFSFEQFLSLRPDLAVKVMEIFTIWLPNENQLIYALLELHDMIVTAYDLFSLSSHEREFIEVDLQNDLSLIIEHYEYDPRDPESGDNESERDEEDGRPTDDVDSGMRARGLDVILEEEEVGGESSDEFR
jgi:hypothetical protein